MTKKDRRAIPSGFLKIGLLVPFSRRERNENNCISNRMAGPSGNSLHMLLDHSPLFGKVLIIEWCLPGHEMKQTKNSVQTEL